MTYYFKSIFFNSRFTRHAKKNRKILDLIKLSKINFRGTRFTRLVRNKFLKSSQFTRVITKNFHDFLDQLKYKFTHYV